MGNANQAIELYEKSYQLLQQKYGDNNIYTANCLENLA
jgi:hypothetical protein